MHIKQEEAKMDMKKSERERERKTQQELKN